MTGQLPMSAPMLRHIRIPAYLILSMAMLLPLLDYANGLVPFRLGDPIWRFGAVSLIASYAVATTVQLFFLFVVAIFAGDRKVLYAVGVFALIAALGLLMGAGMYGLDALQARSQTSAATQSRLEVTAGIAFLKLIALFAANAVLVRFAFRAAGALRPATTTMADRVLVPRPSSSGPKTSL